jgi:type VII secretion integral membrane protein EccD
VLSAPDPGLRRVSVHAGTDVIDLSLPAMVPVATLIPSIIDILGEPAGDLAMRYQLSRPGLPALPASTTLAQNGIRDGTVLVLSQSSTELPAPRHHDAAEAVSAALESGAGPGAGRQARLTGALAAGCLAGIGGLTLVRNALSANVTQYADATAGIAAMAGLIALLFATIAHRAYRDAFVGLTVGVIATGFAAVAGLFAVPNGPGVPNVLLAAMAAAVTSVLAMRVTGCGAVTLTAVACFAILVALAALAGVLTAAPPHAIGAVSVLGSLGLLGVAGRVSIILAGLSPRLPADSVATSAIRADNWLTSLQAAFSASAAVSAIGTAFAVHGTPAGLALGFLTGALLLLRVRAHEGRRTLVLAVSGVATTATTFAVAAAGAPRHGPWIAAITAMLVAVAACAGFVAPTMSPSPVLRRSGELLECLVLTAVAPLACWICGLYSAVRGLDLS